MFALVCISAGMFFLVAQVLYIREILIVAYGNELCLGFIFIAWFLGITSGAGSGAKVTGNKERNLQNLVLVVISLCFLLVLETVVVRSLRSLFFTRTGEYLSFQKLLAGILITVTPFSFLIGFFFPLACQVLSQLYKVKGGVLAVGFVYVWEALGSVIGGIAFSFILVFLFKTFQIIFILGGIFLGIVIFWLFMMGRKKLGFIITSVFLLCIPISLSSAPNIAILGILVISVKISG